MEILLAQQPETVFGLHAASAWVQFARGVPDSHLTFYTGPLSCYEGNPKETFL